MPKNDYICLTSNRQCEICTFLKWIWDEKSREESDGDSESVIG
jgi:hypothetical protein